MFKAINLGSQCSQVAKIVETQILEVAEYYSSYSNYLFTYLTIKCMVFVNILGF